MKEKTLHQTPEFVLHPFVMVLLVFIPSVSLGSKFTEPPNYYIPYSQRLVHRKSLVDKKLKLASFPIALPNLTSPELEVMSPEPCIVSPNKPFMIGSDVSCNNMSAVINVNIVESEITSLSNVQFTFNAALTLQLMSMSSEKRLELKQC